MLENARMVRDVQNTLSLLSKHRQVLHVAEREKKKTAIKNSMIIDRLLRMVNFL